MDDRRHSILAREFRDLADRFVRLRADDLPDAGGNHYASRLAGEAARVAQRAANVLRLPPDLPWPAGPHESPVAAELGWRAAWFVVCRFVAANAEAFRWKYLGDGVTFGHCEARDWRERCENFAAVCRALADLVTEGMAETGSRQGGMTKRRANEKAMDLARDDSSFAEEPNSRRWARLIGCSVGTVSKLPFWQEVMKRTGRGRKAAPGPKPKVKTLTPDVEELERLVHEQATDDAAMRCRKKL